MFRLRGLEKRIERKECLQEARNTKAKDGYLKAKTLGWLLEEIHVTWAHLEKKRTRLLLYTKSLEEIIIQTVETTSPTFATASELDQDDVRNIMTALKYSCLK
ncbi:hypothetical protein Tco_0964371 [Tanacetum coccineum]